MPWTTQSNKSGVDSYLAAAHGNAAKILERGGVWIRLLRDVDSAFVTAEDSLKPIPGTVVGAFVVGSHGSWLAAANLGLCMHAADSFQPLRACIESAFYGYHIHENKLAFERWKHRPTVAKIAAAPASQRQQLERDRKAIGREFSVTSIARTFPQPLTELSERSLKLYDELIDYGAHFNFPVLHRAFRPTGKGADYYSAEVRILLAQEHEQVFVFTKLVEGGICALEVLNAAVADGWDTIRVSSAIAGLKSALQKRPRERLGRRRAT